MSVIRIDKLFSNLGILSRSECKKAIKQGFIKINNELCTSSDTKINTEKDEITYNGIILDTTEFVYYMLNKPAGVITANEDKYSRTIFDLIEDKRTDLSAVGRLDKDTTGILLITNNGDINHRLLSPKNHVTKTYQVVIDGVLTKEDISILERGMDIGDEKPTLPAVVNCITDSYPQNVEFIITEGRFHQVKRMFEAVGKPVLKLHRSDFGPLKLDPNLPEGEYRPLTEEELDKIFKEAGLKK